MSTGLSVPPYSVDRAAVMAETTAIRRHPDFGEALLRYAAAGLDRFDGEPRAAKMICQVARYTLALPCCISNRRMAPMAPARAPRGCASC
jgi:hypothetical protein